MKKLLTLIITAACLAGCDVQYYTPRPYAPQQAPPGDYQNVPAYQPEPDYQTFYDELSPYGQWIDDANYGYVWQPSTTYVGFNFRPYATNGRWVYSDMGWTWASNYQWGWAAFHYGRWFYESGYGWMWAPGNEWAPAWVTWGRSGDYYGWAPLAPRVSLSIGWNPPSNYWNYVPGDRMYSSDVNNYVVVNNTMINRNVVIIDNMNDTRGYGNGRYSRGPVVADVERSIHERVRPVVIRDNDRHGENFGNGTLSIYRPTIRQTNQNNGGNRPAPRNVQPWPSNQGNNNNQQGNPQRPGYTPQPNNQQPANHPGQQGNSNPQQQQRPDRNGGARGNQQPQQQPATPQQQQPLIQPGQQPVQQPRPNRGNGSQPQPQPAQPPVSQPAAQPQQQPPSQPVYQPRPNRGNTNQPVQQPVQQQQPQQQQPRPTQAPPQGSVTPVQQNGQPFRPARGQQPQAQPKKPQEQKKPVEQKPEQRPARVEEVKPVTAPPGQ